MSTTQSQPKTRNNKSTAKHTTTKAKGGAVNNSKSDLQSRIEIAAYYRAEARGFAPGYELSDWLTAEQEVNQ